MELANQYSYIIFSAALIAIILGIMRIALRLRWPLIAAAGMILSAAALLLFIIVRPGSSDVDSLSEADSILSNGHPTLIEFFSNYCVGCITVRPAVDELAGNIRARYNDSFNVLRIDIHTSLGRALRERYGFSFTPEFILLGPDGSEIWRGHAPPGLDTVALLAAS